MADETKLAVIDQAREQLLWAWKTDASWDYPVHTDQVFFEIRQSLKESLSSNYQQGPRTRTILRPKRTIRNLSELVHDRTVQLVYESQNSGAYEDALNNAAFAQDRSAHSSFRKILKAIEKAYEIDKIGIERLPKPRTHLLHRRLLELASELGFSDLTHSGILEFLDDLCPCGKKHTEESIRKLRTRVQQRKKKR